MPAKVKTLDEIANEYGVHKNTLRNWLKPIQHKIKISKRKFLFKWQVDKIYEFLDKP